MQTKLTIKEDKALSFSSSLNGANINSAGFNMDLVTIRYPDLAKELMGIILEVKVREQERRKS